MMDRRELLARLSAAAALPLLSAFTAEDLLALGARAHRRLAARGYAPAALDAHQFRTVTIVSELIVPETETPGATAAGVDRFIDLLVAEWYDDEERARFLAGLLDLDARSRAAHGAEFADASPAQQTGVLEGLEDEYLALRATSPARADRLFFPTIKWLTLFAYYTSEAGATQEHHWVAVPGSYRGCDPLISHSHG